jgi:hypothetical protein
MSDEINTTKQHNFSEKPKHFFAGTLFITLGLLILINNFTNIFLDWAAIWKLWPLFIILIGISILVKNKFGKGLISVFAALVLAFAIFSSFKLAFHFFNNDFDIDFGEGINHEITTTEYSEKFDSTLKAATLNFDAGAGTFNILNTTEDLIYASAEGIKNNFQLTRLDSNGSTNINFNMGDRAIFRFGKNYKNKVDISLNTNPVWEMNFDVGAASMDLDLTKFKTKKIDVDMGAASIDIRLSNLYPETHLTIDAGASDINVFVPKESGCKILTDGALSSKHFDEFEKIDSDNYETENFNSTQNKIYIEIDSGVSSISVERY